MQFDEVVLDPVGAPGVLEGGLDLEDEGVLGHAQVEEAPVHPFVDPGVVGDGGFGDCSAGDLEVVKFDFDAAEFDALVVLEFAGGGEEGALAEAGDDLGEGVVEGRAVFGETAGVDELHRSRFVAQDDELDFLLIANGVDPSGDGDWPVGCGGKVLD